MSVWLDTLQSSLTPEVVAVLREKEAAGRDALEYALGNRLVEAEQILEALSEHYHLPGVELGGYQPDPDVVGLVSEAHARKYDMLPLFRIKDDLYVAMAEPENLMAQDYVSQTTGCTVEPVVALGPDLERAINRLFLTQERASQTISRLAASPDKDQDAEPEVADLGMMDEATAPAVKLVQHILSQGVRLGASDIHIEPYEDRVELRYRIDGVLHRFPPPPTDLGVALVARIKIQSGLDIAEKRLPQDGRSAVLVDGLSYDLRVSIIPNVHGEGVVIRIMNPLAMNQELHELGFPQAMLKQYERIISRPWGILLVTGPTGSGKTTTLYATLKRLYSPEKKMITLEDPVEFKMDGITQIQIRSNIGYTFASGLRAVLRHDPDILMVGEIRDLESADIAVKASLTGHFLFATLHTNNAPQTVSRLIDMGLEPYQIQASLSGVLAQRLVRRLCTKCRQEFEPPASVLEPLGVPASSSDVVLYAPGGCAECNNLGYRGRVAVYELMEMTPDMRRLPRAELTPERLEELARVVGYTTLRESAVEKFLLGQTSLEEVTRLTSEE